jgi:hypothetical protein
MKRAALLVLLAACGGGPAARSRGGPADEALAAFGEGDLDRAEALLAPSKEPEAALHRARIRLLRNRNREAVELLLPLTPPRRPVRTMEDVQFLGQVYQKLALAYVRLDEFGAAAEIYKLLQDSVLHVKYKAMAASIPYLPPKEWNEARIDLLAVDPLPLVQMDVNETQGLFIVDTGLAEIALDWDFAKTARVNAPAFKSGALTKSFTEGFADAVTIGTLRVRNVPVQIGTFPPIAGVRASGAIGLAFLLHFDFTLDLKRSRLVLRKAGGALQGLSALLTDDWRLLVPGTVNGGASHVSPSSALVGVTAAVPPAMADADGVVREITAGPLRLGPLKADPRNFPLGLDGFGFPVGAVLGHAALKGRSLRLEPRSMKLQIE